MIENKGYVSYNFRGRIKKSNRLKFQLIILFIVIKEKFGDLCLEALAPTVLCRIFQTA